MGFNVYLPAGTVIGNIEFNKVKSIEKVSYGIQRCVLLHVATNLNNLFLKNYTREAHLRGIFLEPIQTSDMDLFKKIASGFKSFLIFGKSFILDI